MNYIGGYTAHMDARRCKGNAPDDAKKLNKILSPCAN
jgi:hypothetical protein